MKRLMLLALCFYFAFLPLQVNGQFGESLQVFPHLAVGVGARTSFTVLNTGGAAIDVMIELFRPDGTGLDQMEFNLAGGATSTVSFGGAGEVTSGWAKLTSSGSFTATEFFSIEGVGNVGVAPGQPTTQAKVFSFKSAETSTGLAAANADPVNVAMVTARLFDTGGGALGEVTFPLGPNNQLAKFLDEAPYNMNQSGTVELTSDRPISLLGLRLDGSLLSSVAISIPSGQAAQEAGTFHVFPLVIAGEDEDGSESDGAFFVTNVDGRPTTCTVELIGMPDTIIDGGGVVSLASQGSVALVALEASRVPPGVEVGYATLTCDHAVTGNFIQLFLPPGGPPAEALATINPAARSSLASIPLALDDALGRTVDVAIVNDDSVAADFDVTVFDLSDAVVGTSRVNIPAKTQLLVEDIADLVPLAESLGSIRISSVNAARFYALGIFMEGDTEFTIFPATQLAP